MANKIFIRPGVFVWDNSCEVLFICQDCETNRLGRFMVKDELWHKVCPHDGVICVACFEKRLGRRLTLDDLSDAPINHIAFAVCGKDLPNFP